jgi:hypothetical protein
VQQWNQTPRHAAQAIGRAWRSLFAFRQNGSGSLRRATVSRDGEGGLSAIADDSGVPLGRLLSAAALTLSPPGERAAACPFRSFRLRQSGHICVCWIEARTPAVVASHAGVRKLTPNLGSCLLPGKLSYWQGSKRQDRTPASPAEVGLPSSATGRAPLIALPHSAWRPRSTCNGAARLFSARG